MAWYVCIASGDAVTPTRIAVAEVESDDELDDLPACKPFPARYDHTVKGMVTGRLFDQFFGPFGEHDDAKMVASEQTKISRLLGCEVDDSEISTS